MITLQSEQQALGTIPGTLITLVSEQQAFCSIPGK
jgi:hypothetical protein